MNSTTIILRGDAITRRVGLVLTAVSGVILLILSLLIVVDVLLRYIFLNPIAGGSESVELFLTYIVVLALGYTLAVGGHVRVTLILDRLHSRARLGAEILDRVIGMAFFGLLTYFLWLHFWESFVIMEEMMAAVKLPWWVGKMAMPIGFFVIFLHFLFLLLRLTQPANKQEV